MTTKTAPSEKRRRTTMVPVTTMIPVLSEDERKELLTSLKDAEGRVKAGKAIDYDPKTFKQNLTRIYRGAKR